MVLHKPYIQLGIRINNGIYHQYWNSRVFIDIGCRGHHLKAKSSYNDINAFYKGYK
jgi:hypothetical protein